MDEAGLILSMSKIAMKIQGVNALDYIDVVARLAPCGLDCSRCADYEHGEIRKTSTLLIELLGNYQRLAKMKETAVPAFQSYPQFHDVLRSFAGASCSGCRGEHILCPIQCSARLCHKENGVDFCFQCVEYPCNKQFSGKLRDRWLFINDRMKEIGPESYYLEQVTQPRY
jgi:hypothetical protein